MTTKELLSIKINEPDNEVFNLSRSRWDSLAKPIDGLGKFEEIISSIAAIQGKVCPDITRKAMIIMCADNGVYEEGVSQTSQSVTRDVAELMGDGKSSVGIMAKDYSVDFFVYDVGINCEVTPEGVIDAKIRKGTVNFCKGPAMELSECLAAIQIGIDAVKKCSDEGYGLIATGEMGIGNTTTSTAILCALLGLDPADYVGRGAGLSDDGLKCKIRAIEEGLRKHVNSAENAPCAFGGTDIAEPLYPEENTSGNSDKSGLEKVIKKESIGSIEKLSTITNATISKEQLSTKTNTTISREQVLEILKDLGGLDIAGLVGIFIGGAMYRIPVVIDGLISATAALLADRIIPGCRRYMIQSHMGREKAMEIIMKELDLEPVICADLALGEGTGALLLLPMLDMVMSLYLAGTTFGDTEIEKYERFC